MAKSVVFISNESLCWKSSIPCSIMKIFIGFCDADKNNYTIGSHFHSYIYLIEWHRIFAHHVQAEHELREHFIRIWSKSDEWRLFFFFVLIRQTTHHCWHIWRRKFENEIKSTPKIQKPFCPIILIDLNKKKTTEKILSNVYVLEFAKITSTSSLRKYSKKGK
jgi:hypothetical protein